MTPNFPSPVDIEALDQTHPEIACNADLNQRLKLLYEGGDTLKRHAAMFVQKRERELGSEYLKKLDKFFATPLLSTITSWFTSKLFERQIEITFNGDQTEPLNGYYSDFLKNADRSKVSLEQFFEHQAIDLLVFGRSAFLIDLPKLSVQPTSLAEQQALGGLNPYLVYCDPGTIKNFQYDQYGRLEWILLHSKSEVQTFVGEPKTVEKWSFYDKSTYAIWTARHEGDD